MRTSITLLMLFTAVLSLSLSSAPAEAKTSKKASESRSAQRKTQQAAHQRALGTDHVFSDASVRGKYQYADEGNVTIENEKELIDLLGMRRHFKDRLTSETGRN